MKRRLFHVLLFVCFVTLVQVGNAGADVYLADWGSELYDCTESIGFCSWDVIVGGWLFDPKTAYTIDEWGGMFSGNVMFDNWVTDDPYDGRIEYEITLFPGDWSVVDWDVYADDVSGIVPEPLSATLFIVGGATLGFRQFRKKRTA